MKIIHYIPSIDRSSGGVGSYIQLLAAELGMLVELHIVTHQEDNPLEMSHCEVHYIERFRHYMQMKMQFNDILQSVSPDVVHVNCCWNPECSLVQKWSREKGYKTVYTPHGMLEPWILKRHYWTKKIPALLLYQRAAIKNSTIIHATAESEKENLFHLGYNPQIAVIPNGIEVDSIKMKSDWSRKKKILFLSRIHVKKGVNFLIEAVAQLKEQLAGFQIIIAGEGDMGYVEELKQLAKDLNVAEMFDFIGGVYGDKKWDLYQQADLFILPTHSENFGIVVAEALASGTPVITTKGTPWGELETNHCGWWTEVGIKPTQSAIIDFLGKDERELEIMGRNGRKLVEDKYGITVIAKKMQRLYNWILVEENKPDFVYVTSN